MTRYTAQALPQAPKREFRYLTEDGEPYPVTEPLTLRQMERMGVVPAPDNPEGTYLLFGCTARGAWQPLGPIDGTLIDAVEIMQVNARAPGPYADFRAELRVVVP